MKKWKLLLLVAMGQLVFSQDDQKIVHLEQGPVNGYLDPEGDIFVFYSIPYASVPKGKDKFKAPLPAPTWKYTFEAIKYKEILCPQDLPPSQFDAEFMVVKEDCLIANIYTPKRDITTLLPVLVIIHGGGFNAGFGEFLRPTSLAKTKKVVALTFNYRLGTVGFLCLGTKDVPGNAGLKDQLALLRWVRNNIEKFGGDPKNVTVSGYSTGAASALLLTLSESADGLFQKVIVESGSDLTAFTVQTDPLKTARDIAQLINNTFDVNKTDSLEKLYKEASPQQLLLHGNSEETDANMLFAPCVEKNVGQEMILSDAPINILKSGNFTKVPILWGFTDLEGLSLYGPTLTITFLEAVTENIQKILPANIYFESEEERNKVAAEIKRYYFDNKTVGPELFLEYIKFNSDVYFTIPSLRSIKLRLEANAGPIFLFEYSYCDNETVAAPCIDTCGADHISESVAILNTNDYFLPIAYESNADTYMIMRVLMREMWLNFIMTGKPTPYYPDWPALDTYNSPYMSLNATPSLRKSLLLEKKFQLWNAIFEKYYRTPIPPSPTT